MICSLFETACGKQLLGLCLHPNPVSNSKEDYHEKA